MCHADLYRVSVDLHLISLNKQWIRETDWSRAITCVCPSGRVMYICENRLSCPGKAKSLSEHRCSAGQLSLLKWCSKLKWFQQSVSLPQTGHYISLWMSEQLNERLKTHSKTVSYRHLVVKKWNSTDGQPSRTRRWNINRKSVQVIYILLII